MPTPVALYGLAAAAGLLPADESALLVFREGDEVATVAVQGGKIVFMRSFRLADDMARQLRLSAQAVYLMPERCLLDPDRVLLFGQAREDAVEVAEALSAEAVIHLGGLRGLVRIELAYRPVGRVDEPTTESLAPDQLQLAAGVGALAWGQLGGQTADGSAGEIAGLLVLPQIATGADAGSYV